MKKLFYSERPVNVKIGEQYITFHFAEEGDYEFYYIPIKEWVKQMEEKDPNHHTWQKQMLGKRWFTKDMQEYIDKCVLKKVY